MELVGITLRLGTDQWTQSIHPANSCLERIKLDVHCGPRTLVACLSNLPATVTHLVLDVGGMCTNDLYAELLSPLIATAATQLLEVTVLDSQRLDDDSDYEADSDDDAHVVVARGGWDGAVAELANVRRLEISPAMVPRLWGVLKKLGKLDELVLREGQGQAEEALSPGEVVEYLSRQAGLRKMSANWAVWRKWTLEGCEAVDDVAEKKGVKFTYLD